MGRRKQGVPRKADADDEDCINNDNSDKKSTATATPAVESTVAEKNDEGIMETSAPIGAWKCNVPSLYDRPTDQPTYPPTDWPTDGQDVIEKILNQKRVNPAAWTRSF